MRVHPTLCVSSLVLLLDCFGSRALAYWICRAPFLVTFMLSTTAQLATTLSIGVENSRRPFASRSREVTMILGWSLGALGWVVVGRRWPSRLVGVGSSLLAACSCRSRARPREPGRSHH